MKTAWKAHTGSVAWLTLALVAGLALAHTLVVGAALAGLLPLWGAGMLLVPVAYLWFTPLHEAVHGNIGGTKRLAWLDRGIGWVAGLAFLAPYPAFEAVHLRHHGVANKGERDPDMWVAGSNPLSVTLRCLTIIPHYYWMFGRTLAWESVAMRRAFARTVLGFLGIVGLGTLAVAGGLGAELVMLWVLPGWLASGLLAFAFDWLPHHPHGDTGRFTNARVIEGPAWLTLLLSAQNYHLVHHLWPRVPFYRYPTLFREVRAELEAKNARIETL